jgi:predicted DNA-binding transcriptional regulator YafY
MRADRLVALLLILQRRGQVTASQVAAELEISERTARRDLEALGMAGLPIYSTQGRNGGWQLLGGGRTDLSGLNAAEARALFLVAGPSSSVTPAVKAGLRKLLRALPESMRDEAENASSALIVDPSRWGQKSSEKPEPRWLEELQTAVITGEQITLSYVSPKGEPSTRIVHPLGIAAKGANWYLVGNTDAGMRTFRIDRVSSVAGTGLPALRPEGFELASAWKLITERFEEQRSVSARAHCDPAAIAPLRWVFGTNLRIGPPAANGRIELEISMADQRALVAKLAGFGAMIEVIEPAEFRTELARIGAELTNLYRDTDLTSDLGPSIVKLAAGHTQLAAGPPARI